MVGRPAIWASSQRTGIWSLPSAPNSGHHRVTGSGVERSLLSRRSTQRAATPLVAEKILLQCAVVVRFSRVEAAPSAPYIDNQPAVHVSAECRAQFGATCQVARERLQDAFESGGHVAEDFRRALLWLRHLCCVSLVSAVSPLDQRGQPARVTVTPLVARMPHARSSQVTECLLHRIR